MHLKSIKLAGFKSFVDPISIDFPSNLCGIVGPNGCGKSNIIDAVRWVLGEGSVKQLRSDTSTNIIFSGSNARQPISRASVELIFNNCSGRLQGEYASYHEISIKRRLQRDGNNHYFLNGNKCRRRDITDLFLGTGIGAQGYSIIEQGMISSLITAKPEELRAYIEEAANISKYKERRRETENRIRRTRNNLQQLANIIHESERQLQKLQRQAKIATSYRQLNTQQRQIKQQLLALRWQFHAQQLQRQQNHKQDLHKQLQKQLTEATTVNAKIDALQAKYSEYNQQLSNLQADYYASSTEISTLEQNIQHHHQKHRQLTETMEQTQQALQQIDKDIDTDKRQINGWQSELKQLQKQRQQAHQRLDIKQQVYHQTDSEQEQWQEQWQQWTEQLSITQRQVDHFNTEQQHQQSELQQIDERINDINATLTAQDDETSLNDNIYKLNIHRQSLLEKIDQNRHAISTNQEHLNDRRLRQNQWQNQLNDIRTNIQEQRGQLVSLQALQQISTDDDVQQWQQRQHLTHHPLIYSQLQVTAGWETAVEVVLGKRLHSLCVEDIHIHAPTLDDIQGFVSLVSTDVDTDSSPKPQTITLPLLITYIDSRPIPADLYHIYATENIQQALRQRKHLTAGESIVTRNGIWLGKNWLCNKISHTELGVLQRQHSIDAIQQQLQTLQQQEIEWQKNYQSTLQAIDSLERQQKTLQEQLEQNLATQSQINIDYSNAQSTLTQQRNRQKQLNDDKVNLQNRRKDIQTAITERQETIASSVTKLDQLQRQKQEHINHRQQLQQAFSNAKKEIQQATKTYNDFTLRERTVDTQLKAVEEIQQRLQQQRQRGEQRLSELQKQLQQEIAPDQQLKQQLQIKLQQQLQLEEQVKDIRNQIEQFNAEIRQRQQQREQQQQQIDNRRNTLQQTDLTIQENNTRQNTIEEQLHDVDITTLCAELPKDADITTWTERKQQIDQRIQKLGNVNLVAIDEYDSEQQRKQHLDSQYNELVTALKTLEEAIDNIDRQTRDRFEATFKQINDGLKELFPRLFGGGQASLQLDANDLLNTGVSIMVRPPGKRNTSLHSLSGGEKALTAIAFIFSLFRLNPAPFCLLDEVDAPLDDANVKRFTAMLVDMSKRVQFIMITHNKTTMEHVNQLMGVTMQEAGISRVVSVDINRALAMVDD